MYSYNKQSVISGFRKKSGAVLMLLVLLIVPYCMPEADQIVDSGSCGYGLTWTLDTGGTLVIHGQGEMEDYEDGSSFHLENDAARNRTVKAIIIEEGVTSIGSYAFSSFESVVRVEIPSTVKAIHRGAFEFCTQLSEVKLPAGLTSLGVQAFGSCKALKSIVIPQGVRAIEAGAFNACNALAHVSLPAGLDSIGYAAFTYCMALTEIDIPIGMTEIGEMAFYNCTGLRRLYLPDSVTRLGNSALQHCTRLEDVRLSPNMQEIEKLTFWECTGLKEIEIPQGIKTIGEAAFSTCTALMKVTIPESVTSIGPHCFDSWEIVQSGDGVLRQQYTQNSDLTILGYDNSYASSYAKENGISFISLGTGSTPAENIDFPFPEGIIFQSIGQGLSWSEDSAGELTISGVGWMKDFNSSEPSPFSGKTSVKSLVLKYGVYSIGANAFAGCSEMTEAWIPSSVDSIGEGAFAGCSKVVIYGMPGSAIENYAISNGFSYKSMVSQTSDPEVTPEVTPTEYPQPTTQPQEKPTLSPEPTVTPVVEPAPTPTIEPTPAPVIEPIVEKRLEVNPASLTIRKGKSQRILAVTIPSAKITFKSKNSKIATVSAKGVVKGKKAGTTYIIVKANGITRKIKVKVRKK